MAQSPFYVIGTRGMGVLFVRTSPLRAALVSHQAVLDFEAQHVGVDGYARIAAAASRMSVGKNGDADGMVDSIEARGIEKLIKSGSTVSEATFTFIGDIDDSDLDFNRMSTMPIQAALSALSLSNDSGGDRVVDAVLSDTPVELP